MEDQRDDGKNNGAYWLPIGMAMGLGVGSLLGNMMNGMLIGLGVGGIVVLVKHYRGKKEQSGED